MTEWYSRATLPGCKHACIYSTDWLLNMEHHCTLNFPSIPFLLYFPSHLCSQALVQICSWPKHWMLDNFIFVFVYRWMSQADLFPSADMAEMNRIHYELEYTEGISQQMRIPERLKIASSSSEEPPGPPLDASHSTMMHVPERIVIAGIGRVVVWFLSKWDVKKSSSQLISIFLTDQGDSNDARFGRPRDLDLIQSTPLETVELKTPPRVLTLNDQPLDFLEPEQADNSTAQPRDEVTNEKLQITLSSWHGELRAVVSSQMQSHFRSRRERCRSENSTMRRNGQLNKQDLWVNIH